MIQFDPSHEPRKEKLDPSVLRAASYRDLAHWIAILDLDVNRLEAEDSFLDWILRNSVDARPMDEGGLVVRGGSGSFLFIDADTYDLCQQQLEEVKPFFLQGSPPSNSSESSDAPAK